MAHGVDIDYKQIGDKMPLATPYKQKHNKIYNNKYHGSKRECTQQQQAVASQRECVVRADNHAHWYWCIR